MKNSRLIYIKGGNGSMRKFHKDRIGEEHQKYKKKVLSNRDNIYILEKYFKGQEDQFK